MTIDLLFYIATAAFGWGLSLATYRLIASRNHWPMGRMQAERPVLTQCIGLFAVLVSFLFIAARASDQSSGWVILLLGILFAAFWTGFLRVASQFSLFLAPLATILLLVGWFTPRLPAADAPPSTAPLPGESMSLPGRILPRVLQPAPRVEDRTQPGGQPAPVLVPPLPLEPKRPAP